MFPYAVDVPMERAPWSNWVVIAVNLAVFFLMPGLDEDTLELYWPYLLNTGTATGWVTSLFLHNGFMHLIGNMWCLWLFGNAVCAKLGNLRYPVLYLLFGLAADAAHVLTSDMPALGASGAINGVCGLYLALYPLNHVSCFYRFFMRFGVVRLPGWILLAVWFAFDLLGSAGGGGSVAYTAHIGGFVAGLLMGLLGLETRRIVMVYGEASLLHVLGRLPPIENPRRRRETFSDGQFPGAAPGGRREPVKAKKHMRWDAAARVADRQDELTVVSLEPPPSDARAATPEAEGLPPWLARGDAGAAGHLPPVPPPSVSAFSSTGWRPAAEAKAEADGPEILEFRPTAKTAAPETLPDAAPKRSAPAAAPARPAPPSTDAVLFPSPAEIKGSVAGPRARAPEAPAVSGAGRFADLAADAATANPFDTREQRSDLFGVGRLDATPAASGVFGSGSGAGDEPFGNPPSSPAPPVFSGAERPSPSPAPAAAPTRVVACACGKRLRVPANASGRTGRCPGCGASIRL